jgi:uncharacterized membrane protein
MKDILMKFLRIWNRFFFVPTYNVFDIIVLITVVHLLATYSWWWALLYVPTIIVSAIMQQIVEADNANS